MKSRKKSTKKNPKKMSSIIMLLVVVVVGMSLAYAALSTTLTVTINKITQQAISGGWNVQFETSGSPISATVGGTGDTGRSCGTATVTATTVTVADTTLSKPDDSCTYALTIKNTGGIDATLGTITPVKPNSSCTTSGASMVCGEVTYTLATNSAGTTLLTTGGTLAKTTGTLPVYLVLKYTGSAPVTTAKTWSGGGFTLVYNQK